MGLKRLIRLLALTSSLAAATLLLFALPACSARDDSSSGTTTISFLTMQLQPTFNDYFNGLIKDFEATHPGVKVKWLDYPFQNYETKVMTSFLGNNPPDVINLSSDNLPTWVAAGYILPLKGVVPEGTLTSFVPNIVEEGCTVDGQPYALPWYLTSVVALANKKIFEEAGLPIDAPPRYLDDLPALCKTIKEKTGKYGYFPLYTEMGSMKGWLLDGSVPLLNKDQTKATFYTPRAVQIVKFWTDLYKEGLVPSEALTAMHRRPIELYKTGRLALLNTGTEFIRQIKSDAPEVYANTVIGPQMLWKGQMLHPLQFHVITVAKQTKHPKLAAEFAAYLTDAKNQLAFCKLTTILPSALAAVNDPYFSKADDSLEGKARRYASKQILEGTVIRLPTDQKKLTKVMDDTVENICLGKISADEGVKQTVEAWDKILSERGK